MKCAAAIPEALTEKLLFKINLQVFDLSNYLTLCYDENCSFHKYYNIATQDITAFQDIFLVDHMYPPLPYCTSLVIKFSRWSFENPETVCEQLKQSKQLQESMAMILNLPLEHYQDKEEDQLIRDIWKEMWLFVSSYDNSNGQTIFFVPDQIGCGFLPSCEKIPQEAGLSIRYPNYTTPFESCVYHAPDGTTYSVVWPVRDIEVNEPLLCSSMGLGLISRIALLKVVDCEPFISTEDYGLLIEDLEDEGEENTQKEEGETEEIEEDGEDIMDPHHLSFPSFLSSEESHSAIKLLSNLLSTSDYSVQSITAILQLSGFDYCLPVWELSSPKYQKLMYSRLRTYLETNQFTQSASNICCLIVLFCLGISLPLNEAATCLSPELLSSLLKLGVLTYQSLEVITYSIAPSSPSHSSGVVTSVVQIIPTFHINSQTTLFFMTDFSHHSSYSEVTSSAYETYFEPVMYIGPDSLALFQSISHAKGSHFPSQSRGLDVFCGCGIQGITALKVNLLDKVTFVEKNHRAIRFLRFNLLLNSIPLERAQIIHDSVYNIHSHLSVKNDDNSSQLSQQFQLILANPPYIPTGLDKRKRDPNIDLERGLLGYGAGGAGGEEFISFVYTDLIRYLGLPNSPSESCCAGIYLVSNLVNVHQYPTKLSYWLEQSSGNLQFVHQLNQQESVFSGFISHDKPWTPQEYAQLIFNRENQLNNSSTSSASISESNPNVDQYAQDLIDMGIESVCNGLVFLKLRSSDEQTTPALIETHVEECPEQVWQLLNLSETLKERYLEIQQKISEFLI